MNIFMYCLYLLQIFDTNGLLRYLFGVAGKEEGCLWYPRKVAVLRPSGSFVVCDRGGERSRMQIFDSRGNFLLRIAIRFIDIVAGLAVSRRGHIVAVDSVTPTVFFISEQGRLDKYLECSEFMTEPSDIAVHEDEYYICDFKVRISKIHYLKSRFVFRGKVTISFPFYNETVGRNVFCSLSFLLLQCSPVILLKKFALSLIKKCVFSHVPLIS